MAGPPNQRLLDAPATTVFPRESGHCTVTYGRAAQAERKIKLFVLAKGEKEQTFGYISCVPVKVLDIFISFYFFLHSISL